MTEELIKAVEPYAELYNRAHPQHKNAERKQEIWETIGSNLTIPLTGPEAAKRWKDIRDSFVKSRRRGLPPRNPNKVYKPYRHAGLLDFLLPCLLGPNTRIKRPANDSLENGEGDAKVTTNEVTRPEKKPKKLIPKISVQETNDTKDKDDPNQEMDEDDLFFRSMAYSCKKLPPNVKSFVRFKIHEIIFQAENQIIAISDMTQPSVTVNE